MKQKNKSIVEQKMLILNKAITTNCKQINEIKELFVSAGNYEQAAYAISLESYLLEIQQKIFSFLNSEQEKTKSKNRGKARFRLI